MFINKKVLPLSMNNKQTTYSITDSIQNVKAATVQTHVQFQWECGNEVHPWDVTNDSTGEKLYSFDQLK